jgi:hypothetical protein
MSFLKNFIHKLRDILFGQEPVAPVPVSRPQPDARRGRIEKEPMLALKDGKLVVVVDYMFEDVPSWIEWDQEREILSITQMGGQMDEMKVAIRKDHYDVLEQTRKVLLVSNDNKGNDEKIVHYLSLLTRK